MYPGDNESGKRTVGPFSKTPLIRYPAGSPDFSPGPRAPLTQPSSQVFSLPLNSASPTLSPPCSFSPSSFNDIELILNGDSSHGKEPMEELSDEILKLIEEENGNEQTNLGVKRRAENSIDPLPKSNNISSSKDKPYTQQELQQISTCKRLKGLASDPKKVRRILAMRETAKRSEQRKSQYIIDLETKVATLSNENASIKIKLAISEKRCQALEQRIRDPNNSEMQQLIVATDEEMQRNNQFDEQNMWNQSSINEFNQEQTYLEFENSNGQF